MIAFHYALKCETSISATCKLSKKSTKRKLQHRYLRLIMMLELLEYV